MSNEFKRKNPVTDVHLWDDRWMASCNAEWKWVQRRLPFWLLNISKRVWPSRRVTGSVTVTASSRHVLASNTPREVKGSATLSAQVCLESKIASSWIQTRAVRKLVYLGTLAFSDLAAHFHRFCSYPSCFLCSPVIMVTNFLRDINIKIAYNHWATNFQITPRG